MQTNEERNARETLGPDGPAPRPASPRRPPPWLRGLLAAAALYLFIASVNMMGTGLKCIAKDEAGKAFLHDNLFAQVSDPLTGLFVGLLVTSLVQSSSFTTSMAVGLVATGDLSLSVTIPIIMGANIGTSVTNLLVSLGQVRRRREFRRSFAAAVVHDFFNVLSVLVLLPLEHAFGIISRLTEQAAEVLGRTDFLSADAASQMGVLKSFFGLVGRLATWLLLDGFGMSPTVAGAVTAAGALVLLFSALWLLVKMLKGLLQQRLSNFFSTSLFRNPATAFAVGILVTVSVQSSSVTTSLIVPLVGAGILRIKRVYPYTLGANIGTTCTALLAALGTGSSAALACAFGHLLFNVYGTIIFWPLQFIPISLAKGFAKLVSRRRAMAVVFLLGLFFVLPISAIAMVRWIWH